MARYHQQRYPIGSVISGTMRPEDLIPAFVYELEYRMRNKQRVSREHRKLVRDITQRIQDEREFENQDLGIAGCADDDLESLFDALGEYAGPYFYFGAHLGDGADYGYWLSESWDEDFKSVPPRYFLPALNTHSIKVNDLSEVPTGFRGEVAVVNDHGNVTLYQKTSRKLHEIWSIV